MAAVAIGLAVLSLAHDPSQRIAAYSSDWTEQTEQDGSVRVMANGRRRVVTRRGDSRQIGWTMPLLTKAEVETVKAWAGQIVMIRDSKGRKEYGVYFGVSVADYKDRPAHAVTFALQSVSFSEVV